MTRLAELEIGWRVRSIPRAETWEAESQEVRQLVSRWTELEVLDGVLVCMRLGKAQAVLPNRLRQVVFRHMHVSPLSAGHMDLQTSTRESMVARL
jgi:hypothetical protein